MANTKSAAKRARQTERRTLVNKRALTTVKNELKKFRSVSTGTDKEAVRAAALAFVSTIDKAVKTGRVHKNSADRHKSAVGKVLAKLA